MKIAPIHAFQTNIDLPIESGIVGQSPMFVREGFIIFRITGVVVQPTYGLLVRAFPDDYEMIRPHEQILRVKLAAKQHDLQSGTVNKPVCLLHQPDESISRLLQSGFDKGRVIASLRQEDCYYEYAVYEDAFWAREIKQLVEALDKWVIADGHHRTAAYFSILENNGPGHGLFSALIPLDQVKVRSYHRLLRVSETQFPQLRQLLRTHYSVQKATPEEVESMYENTVTGLDFLLLYRKGIWKKLKPELRKSLVRKGSADLLLQFEELILNPFIARYELQKYGQLEFISGSELDLEKLNPDSEEILILFPPVTREYLWESSLRGEIMPAKSTWIEPRMPAGVIQVLSLA